MIRKKVFLDKNYIPMQTSTACCNKCHNEFIITKNHKPRYCDMCGEKITDNLDELNINDVHPISYTEYIKTILELNPDWVIKKINYYRTEAGMIGIAESYADMFIGIGPDSQTILDFINIRNNTNFRLEDLEDSTVHNLLEHAKTCNKYIK